MARLRLDDSAPIRPRRQRPRRWNRTVLLVLGLILGPSVAMDLSLAALRPLTADGGTCRITRVIDGDTVDLWCPSGLYRVRLMGFDTPELYSPRCASELLRAMQAKWVLRWWIWRADTVAVVREGTDRYDRALGRMFVDGAPIARRMIAEGHAVPYDGGTRQGWCS
jgi:endonuclease YncB( thermonuclease family)